MNPFTYALKRGDFTAAKFCLDCMIVTVGGDDSGAPESWDRATYARTASTYDITPGHLRAGRLCGEDCDCERDQFSSRPCDGCGTTLYGERGDVILVSRAALRAYATHGRTLADRAVRELAAGWISPGRRHITAYATGAMGWSKRGLIAELREDLADVLTDPLSYDPGAEAELRALLRAARTPSL